MNTLDEIAIAAGTDKSSRTHNYCVKYEKHLPFDRHTAISMLEIGILRGESLRMWANWFVNAKITGIDIDALCRQHATDRINVEIGSQSDSAFLRKVNAFHGPFQLIVDDGSHMPADVIASFETLWPLLSPGGVYVVEDTCCSYWKAFHGGWRTKGTAVDYFKNLIDDVNLRGHYQHTYPVRFARREDTLIPYLREHFPDIRTDIESVVFVNSMVFVTKRDGNA